MTANKELRDQIQASELKHWQVADQLGISYTTFSVWMRHELPEEKKNAILEAIKEIKENESV